MEQIGSAVWTATYNSLSRFGTYIPQFIGGLIILIIGLVIASTLKEIVLRLFRYVNLEKWFAKAGLKKVLQWGNWANIVAEIVRWAVVIIFLIPAVEAWGLPQVTSVLNQLLLYIPNVLVAVVVAFVGLTVSNIVSDVVRNAATDMGSDGADLLSNIARYSLVFFTSLVVLNQLGVAADLIRILFTGIIAMLAIAGGLAFGLGGQDKARSLLDSFSRKLEKERPRLTQIARRRKR